MEQETLVCHECDLIVSVPKELTPGHKLVCPRCHKTISLGLTHPKQNVFAFTISSLTLLLLANFFPFLTFEAQGRSQSISLLQTASEMYQQEYILMAMLIYLFIFCLPLLYILSLMFFLLVAQFKVLPRLALESAKLVSKLLPWCMADVFFTGVVVALIKIIAMAEIVFGIAFYAYLMFAITFLYLTQVVDFHRLWGWYSEAYEGQSGS